MRICKRTRPIPWAMAVGMLFIAACGVQAPPESPAAAESAQAAAPPPEPPMPPGFATPDEALIAVASGAVPTIDTAMPTPADVRQITDIEYGKAGDISLKLDLYLPREPRGLLPGLIFIHGGGWESGERQVYHYYTFKYAQKGYAAATMSYRLSGVAPFPAAVHDVKGAVRWMRANAGEYGIDPDRIAVLGGSAGGHLSMMVGYTPGDPELEGDVGHPGVSSAVQAVVNYYGPCDLTTTLGQESRVARKFMGALYDENPDIYRQASPLFHLTADAPPTLIFHGTIDDIVPIEQSDRLAARLAELGVPHVYEKFPGWPHTMDLALPVNDRCQWILDRFLEEHLRAAE